MTKKELSEYRSIAAELEEIQIRLNSNTVHGVVTGSDHEFPYVKRSIQVSGVEETSQSQRDMFLKRKLEVQKQDIEDFVDNIPDSITRRIFRYRYIDGKVRPSWQWIAVRIGATDESYPRRIHNKYLKNI